MNPRTLLSAVRTFVYGGLSSFFALCGIENVDWIDAALVGGVLADYLTWLVMNLVQLPDDLLHGCYEGVINILFGYLLFHFVSVEKSLQGQDLIVAFVAFMIVLAIKLIVYGLRYLKDTVEGSDD